MKNRISKKGREVLALLAKSGELAFRKTPGGYFRVVSENRAQWMGFHRKTLLYAIHSLYRDGFAVVAEERDGVTRVAATEEGKRFVREKETAMRPREWDKKWRLVFFDIPEGKKKMRDSFRYHLQKMGLIEFQRSSFIYPFPCFKEVGALAEQFGVKEHIVLMTAETLSNEFKFKEHFGLV